MEEDRLIFKLKEFYILEKYQVELYQAQAKQVEEPHFKKAFERFAAREQEHVDYFTQKLAERGSSPPGIIGPAFAAAGFVTGKSSALLGLKESFKLGITFENKAVSMYYSFIEMSEDDPRLRELTEHLWYFMIDEESHQLWFKEQLAKLELAAGKRP